MKVLERPQHRRCSRTDKLVASGGIWPKFEVVQAFKHVIVSCQNQGHEESEVARVATIFIPVHDQIWPNFELI